MCGDIGAHAAGMVYCVTISSCQDLGDFRRAAEWTEAANRWCDRLDVTGFPGACRIHRAEALRLRGDWPAAEAQAVAACEELLDFDRMITAGGYYEIAEIRRRRGDFAGAEEAYADVERARARPAAGARAAAARRGQGRRGGRGDHAHARRDRGAARSGCGACPRRSRSRSPRGDLRTARAAADEFESIIDAYRIGGPADGCLRRDARTSRAAAIALAEKDPEDAAARRSGTRATNGRASARRTRPRRRGSLLGIAFKRLGDEHGASVELEGALAAFERLGAKLDEARAKELLGRVEARRTFLFTDIVDSTRLAQTLGDEKWRRLLARHDELVEGGDRARRAARS